MKELLLGLGFLLVVGVAGFVYRVVIERPAPTLSVCTEDAKVCPDGASVERSGPSCSFAPCPPPNLFIPEANLTLVLPKGYSFFNQGEIYGRGYVGSLVSTTTDPTISSMAIYQYRIPENGKNFESILLEETIHGASGEKVKSLDAFSRQMIGGKEYYGIVVERFEGVVASVYYLQRENTVIRFEILEHDVKEWMNPKLVVTELPAHTVFLKVLETLQ